MIRNYLITAIRNLRKNKAHSFINIAGLSVGMAVAMLIGLWVWDEFSFDKYHQNYNSIAQVMQSTTANGTIQTDGVIPVPLEDAMRKNYGSDFKHIAMVSWDGNQVLGTGDKNISFNGNYMGQEAPDIFTLNMLKGSRNALQGTSSLFLSQSTAAALFGNGEPMGKTIKLNGDVFKVTGVYEDLPLNSTFHNIQFIGPWNYYKYDILGKRSLTDWGDNSFFLYVQMADHVDINSVSAKIKYIKRDNAPGEVKFKPEIFLQPMSRWHLYSEFKNGANTGGDIEYVWLFGITGAFVLLLACINFMNLSTARSEKRAKEVGIRKAVGSLRGQLVLQFYCESLLMAMYAFVISLALVFLALPFFNQLAAKQVSLPLQNPVFWAMALGFTLFTGLVAGSYPALYLSSFKPVKVLKGVFKASRLAALPRKVLVVVQFGVSVILIIGTIVVFKQIQFAQNRPVGYNREGLVTIEDITGDLEGHYNAIKTDLLASPGIATVTESSSPATGVNNNRGDVSWQGKDPAMTTDFANIRITTDFGKTMGWQFVAGRDFEEGLTTDSESVVINEAAVKYMNITNPVGKLMQFGGRNHRVIGVIKNMVMGSPYDPVKQTVFALTSQDFGYITIKIKPGTGIQDALHSIQAVCKTYTPAVPFAYKFVDDEYERKFADEQRIGKLAMVFAMLAIFISCLGLFGMATFMAEQRVKEIGVRKVLGASVVNLWGLLSRDFVVLVVVSLFIAIPLSYYLMGNWLLHYEYRAPLSWWVFAAAGAGAVVITLLTVSYQSIKAALMNPVRSLRSE